MEEDRVFRLTEIVKIFGINRHLVINLVQRRILKPLKDVRGRGKSRLYSYANLVQLGVFLHLTKLSISYGRASQLLGIIRSMENRGTLKELHYICVVGFTTGEYQEVNVFGDYEEKILPEKALSLVIKYFTGGGRDPIKDMEAKITVMAPSLSEIKSGIKENWMSYYFVVNVKNIKRYIDSKIRELYFFLVWVVKEYTINVKRT